MSLVVRRNLESGKNHDPVGLKHFTKRVNIFNISMIRQPHHGNIQINTFLQ